MGTDINRMTVTEEHSYMYTFDTIQDYARNPVCDTPDVARKFKHCNFQLRILKGIATFSCVY